jgi:phage internal scaffolding protein
MSYAYREAVKKNNGKKLTKTQLRKFLQKEPRINADGSPKYFTEQSHKDICDINNIIKTYDKTGLLNHVNNMEYQYGNLSGEDFKTMADTVIAAQEAFDGLPSHVRTEFRNSPEEFLRFMDNPDNREKAIQLGLIESDWTPGTDGLGEHIQNATQREKIEPAPSQGDPQPTE